jgi:hypothetical protein
MRKKLGKILNIEWSIGAEHSLYHVDGCWYNPLNRFPGAYCNPNGYILFPTKQSYFNSPYFEIGVKVNLKSGIENIERVPGFVRMKG